MEVVDNGDDDDDDDDSDGRHWHEHRHFSKRQRRRRRKWRRQHVRRHSISRLWLTYWRFWATEMNRRLDSIAFLTSAQNWFTSFGIRLTFLWRFRCNTELQITTKDVFLSRLLTWKNDKYVSSNRSHPSPGHRDEGRCSNQLLKTSDPEFCVNWSRPSRRLGGLLHSTEVHSSCSPQQPRVRFSVLLKIYSAVAEI